MKMKPKGYGRIAHERAIRGLVSRPVSCWKERDWKRVKATFDAAAREDSEEMATRAIKRKADGGGPGFNDPELKKQAIPTIVDVMLAIAPTQAMARA